MLEQGEKSFLCLAKLNLHLSQLLSPLKDCSIYPLTPVRAALEVSKPAAGLYSLPLPLLCSSVFSLISNSLSFPM